MNESNSTVFRCPTCEQRLRVPNALGNLRVTCPKCRCGWDWSTPHSTSKPATRSPAKIAWLLGIATFVLSFCAFAAGNNKSPTTTQNNRDPGSNRPSYGDVSTTYASTPSGRWSAPQHASPAFITDKYSRYYDFNYRPSVGHHYVAGYYRNGSYVSGHYRTNPDDSFWNNWSSKGNLNPIPGGVGTKLPRKSSSGRYR